MYFPRADIHELLTPDILHQLIKGVFKDHLFTWIQRYIEVEHGSAAAKKIMDDIDRKIASVPSFPGLRRFPEGRNFKQWTGDDSKALMKVCIPAIAEHVPDEMIYTLRAYMDFCYMARRSSHTEDTLNDMSSCLERFYKYRPIFKDHGIRENFNLPRQHSLAHYIVSIRLFGSPNGVCSSITESKHIDAVKKPWRRTNKDNPLLQILAINVRMSKIAAARADFARRGMLNDLPKPGKHDRLFNIEGEKPDDTAGTMDDVAGAEGEPLVTPPVLASKPVCSKPVKEIAKRIKQPDLLIHIRRFLQQQLYPDPDLESLPVDMCPEFNGKVSLYSSTRGTFYAPSEACGNGGMHAETVRSTSSWRNGSERRDTVLVQAGSDDEPMGGLVIGRVRAFLAIDHKREHYPCALVEWLTPVDDQPDPLTGCWIVKPETIRSSGKRVVNLISLDTIVRSCLLQGVTGSSFIPKDFEHHETHTSFKTFYFNKYADYHTHETYPTS
jgi:hypothetical protein